ncbi:MAG: 6-phosphofructokinase [Saprospiraceae bacterium]|nr:6-phosphofructokinase [Saprospiraceae bacterium]
MKKIAVFTSGGDSPGMNANVRAVVRTALYYGISVVGIRNGYEGLIDGDMFEMSSKDVSNILQLGGTILGTARSERFMTVEGRNQAYANLQKFGIEGIVACGGNGTFTGAMVFMSEHPDIRIVGTPGTIDNDLYGTDYTIGYDTAVNTAMNAIDNIKDTANSHGRVFFVEVMGRDAGFIALRSAIAVGAEAVLVPEAFTDLNVLVKTLNTNYENKKRASIVIVAEGDDAGDAFEVVRQIKSRLLSKDIRVTVLGHIQRGGRPTVADRVLASRLGLEAVRALRDGKVGVAIGQISGDISYTPFEVAIKHNQKINQAWLEMVDILS